VVAVIGTQVMQPAVTVKAAHRGQRWASSATLLYIGFYLVTAAGIVYTGIDGEWLLLFASAFAARMLLTSIGYHRYFAHKAYRTSRAFQFVLAFLCSLLLQGGVLWWAETHRRHHRYADKPEDLHSPRHRGVLYSHYGWFLDRRHRGTRREGITDLVRFPELVWLDRYHPLLFAMHAALLVWIFGFGALVWAVLLPTIGVWEVTHWVQSFSHCWRGYRRWETNDLSRNHWLLAVIAMGEFHNNHHHQARSARQGHVWWELDAGYAALRALAGMGLIWDLKVPAHRTSI
jgi:stearoyl-CoA desaturase (delta-9 desaturase)